MYLLQNLDDIHQLLLSKLFLIYRTKRTFGDYDYDLLWAFGDIDEPEGNAEISCDNDKGNN